MSPPCPATRSTIVNGVNVTALMDTIQAVQRDPEIAKFNFRARNIWMSGDRNRTTIKDFTGACAEHRTGVQGFVADTSEPEVLLGHDTAPNPVEWLLHALIACMTTTTAYHAAATGIEIKAIESELDGDLDLRGFLGFSLDIPKGYSAIRVRMRVETEAAAEAIKALTRMSPVFEMVSKSVPVAVSIETY
jgi:uncharacterized OsmC-like protein